ncbi:MAG: hypothetical protein ACD_40C00335G0004 [uncultured bacterium]|nr:MAG: hypothetical protein ACD_40C00335G0004 [uncultured bacterium]
MFRRHSQTIVLSLILILAATLRFYRLPDMARYNFDQAYASDFVWNVVKVYPIQMVGQGLSVMGLFMGPWYFYFLVPFYLLTGLHPLGGYIASVIIGLATVITYFFVARHFFGSRAGLLAAFIQAISLDAVYTDWQMTPAFSSTMVALLTWYLFHLYWQGKTHTLPYLAFIFGLYTSFHPIQFPFYLVFLFLFLTKHHLPSLKTTLLSLVAFLLPVSPLLAFEYFRKFAMFRQLVAMFTTSSASAPTNLFRLNYFAKLLPLHFFNAVGLPSIPSILLIVTTLLVLLYISFGRRLAKYRSFHLTLLPVTFVVFFAYYAVYPGNVSEYYYNALFTLTFLYFVAFLSSFSHHRLGQALIIILLVNATLYTLAQLNGNWTSSHRQNLADKDAIVKRIIQYQKKYPTSEFFVSHIALPGTNFGYDYLFRLYGYIPQTRAAVDPIYTIVSPSSLSPDSIRFSSGALGLIPPNGYQ